MMIERNTNYAYQLKYMDYPTFDKVRDLSTKFYRELPKALQNELYETLNRGVDILDSEPQMTAYLFAFGKMHQAKLKYAFNKLPEDFLELPEINIIDYGCGQALGTMCFADFLRENGYTQKVKTITLIEPSEICLKRAALHASVFFPDAEIKTINKSFNILNDVDFSGEEDMPTLHILSNVLDVLSFDIVKFAKVIDSITYDYDQFVCVGPYFNCPEKDKRMAKFCSLLDGDNYYSESFDKYEFDEAKPWTAQILCFSTFDKEAYNLWAETTQIEIDYGIEDEYGVVYSKDGNRLLKCNNSKLKTYSIKSGTKEICYLAFELCSLLSHITIPDSVTKIGDQAFLACKSLKQINIPNSVTSIGYDAFSQCESLQQIIIPVSVTSIGQSAFYRCASLQEITIPNSVIRIDYWTFHGCTSLHNIIIPNSVTVIGGYAFSECESLQHITLPDSLCNIMEFAFEDCKSLQTINIPSSVNHIRSGAFSRCSSLQQVTIPGSVTEIGDEIYYESAFKDCESLQQIIIPKGSTERFQEMLDEELWDKLVEE